MVTIPPVCYEPKPQFWHCSALVEGKWITYGGYFGSSVDPPTSVEVFDPDSEEWTQMTTSGTPPSGIFGAACVAVGPVLYHVCGHDGDNNYNTIYCLDTTVMEW